MKIVFMGTPDYAVKTLEALIGAGHTVAAVFAQPDKPVGRKQILTPPPVKVCAQMYGIPVFQPRTLRDGEAEKIIRNISPDVIAVVAYGKILPTEILTLPRYGCVNGHASLLPKYRGAAPIQWCIVNGEKETGVTAMQMDEGMDTGDILETAVTEIGAEETAGELFERLSVIGAKLLVKTLADIENGNVTPIKQDESKATSAPIIKKEMAKISFHDMTADEVHNAVRGFYPWPVAFFISGGKRIKIIKSRVVNMRGTAGAVLKSDNELIVACKKEAVSLETIQPEGSKPMTAKQYLCGRPIALGTEIEDENG